MKSPAGKFGKLELIAFTSGFSLMAFELIGARMLAPTIGSSTYVWTSVIGVIIAALSIGYFVGGKVADVRGRAGDVALLCLASAFAIGSMLLLFDGIMEWVVQLSPDLRLRGVVASLLLFAPASLVLGMLSPYLVKLKVTSLAVSGQSVAALSASNSIGGIAGTFITGFVVFSYVGSREALVVLVLLMLGASWLVHFKEGWKLRVLFSLVSLFIVIIPLGYKTNVIRIDTPSSHYEIRTGYRHGDTAQPIRYLTTGPGGAQSGIYTNQPNELPFWYTQQIVRSVAQAADKRNILVLGGGAFTIPEYLARHNPKSTIDVVEIDPSLKEIAKKYFDYQSLENIHAIDGDARTYVNTAAKQYDVVIVDVYSDVSVPFSLLTQEYAQRLGAITTNGGVVIINAIAAETGSCAELLQAIDVTYRAVMPYATITRENPAQKGERGNLVLTYSRKDRAFSGSIPFHSLGGDSYTDNFMPAERLQQVCQETV
jgi:predicted O-methyltransferase YrrM